MKVEVLEIVFGVIKVFVCGVECFLFDVDILDVDFWCFWLFFMILFEKLFVCYDYGIFFIMIFKVLVFC